MGTGWLDEDEARAWRGWLTMSTLLRSQVGRDLQAESGLSEPDYAVLVVLSESPEGRVRMSDLAALLQWSKSRLSHQASRMERRGLVRREGCPSDARGSFAVLTDDGRAEIERAAPLHVASVRRHFVEQLDEGELRDLAAISEKLTTYLTSLEGVACPESLAAEAP